MKLFFETYFFLIKEDIFLRIPALICFHYIENYSSNFSIPIMERNGAIILNNLHRRLTKEFTLFKWEVEQDGNFDGEAIKRNWLRLYYAHFSPWKLFQG